MCSGRCCLECTYIGTLTLFCSHGLTTPHLLEPLPSRTVPLSSTLFLQTDWVPLRTERTRYGKKQRRGLSFVAFPRSSACRYDYTPWIIPQATVVTKTYCAVLSMVPACEVQHCSCCESGFNCARKYESATFSWPSARAGCIKMIIRKLTATHMDLGVGTISRYATRG